MIYLYSDVLTEVGGVETYLHALATKLDQEGRPFRIAVSEQEPETAPCPYLDEFEEKGIDVYRQPYVPGDRWHIRKRLLMLWLWWHLEPGDWVYCVRQPIPALYEELVRLVHAKGAKIGASWMFAPEFLVPDPPYFDSFCRAVKQTDAVVSMSECTVHQFEEVYGYNGPVDVVRLHNLPLFEDAVPLPEGPPWHIGFIGRLSIEQKNLDAILEAFKRLRETHSDIHLNLHGDGPDERTLKKLATELNIREAVTFHGRYDHRHDLPTIMRENHLFVHTSLYEGGPPLTVLEILQAGRYLITSPVGGIPDVYSNRPDLGLMASPDSVSEIAGTLDNALRRIRHGDVAPSQIRNRYEEEFNLDSAHEGWLKTLGLSAT